MARGAGACISANWHKAILTREIAFPMQSFDSLLLQQTRVEGVRSRPPSRGPWKSTKGFMARREGDEEEKRPRRRLEHL